MRKALAGLVLGTVVLGQAISAVAAPAKPTAPMAARIGLANNQAVLGIFAAQGSNPECTPRSPEDRSCQPGNNGGLNDGNSSTLPIVLGAGAVGLAIAMAAGGGGGNSGNNGGGPNSP